MPAESPVARAADALRCFWPAILLVALAGAAFLGCLGSIEIWGKREQRAAAEAIDTLVHRHWLVARIQGRPRLEKPPLLRWAVAALLGVLGHRDEWVLRLPGALAGIATVAIVHRLGRRMAGPALGNASALVLCSLGFFVGEMRQASNDAPLALFTSVALYAAWRLLHDEPRPPRRWHLLFYGALGLGFLTKGPVVVLLAGFTVVPYTFAWGGVRSGLRRLACPWGLWLFATLALSWPVAVLVHDPGALRVWTLEMTEKTGLSRILEHRRHTPLLAHWPALILPWPVIGSVAVVMPWLTGRARMRRLPEQIRHSRAGACELAPAPVRYAWWWAIGNLLMFSMWAVAKPNYYVPCLPGAALLIAATWVLLARSARGRGPCAFAARLILQAQWTLLLVAPALVPLLARQWLAPPAWPWLAPMVLPMVLGVPLSVLSWKRGADAMSLAPLAAASVLCILIAFGWVAPAENLRRGHRALAETIARLVPPDTRAVQFFEEIDEGLEFYLRDLQLTPEPEDFSERSSAYELVMGDSEREHSRDSRRAIEARLRRRDRQALLAWLGNHDPSRPYLLIRKSLYQRHEEDLAGRVVPLLEEVGLKRNELVLVKAVGGDEPRLARDQDVIGTRR
jgi:4-amino-4-deoxy-L-arabinose transferase-like glycosyltransferase